MVNNGSNNGTVGQPAAEPPAEPAAAEPPAAEPPAEPLEAAANGPNAAEVKAAWRKAKNKATNLKTNNVKNTNREEFNSKRKTFVAIANNKISSGNGNANAANTAYATLKNYYNTHQKNAPAAPAAGPNAGTEGPNAGAGGPNSSVINGMIRSLRNEANKSNAELKTAVNAISNTGLLKGISNKLSITNASSNNARRNEIFKDSYS